MIRPPEFNDEEQTTWQKQAARSLQYAVEEQIQNALKPLDGRLKVLENILLPLLRELEDAGGGIKNFPNGLEIKSE